MNDVLIVEDHPFVAEATKELISRTEPTLAVTVCSTAESALEELQRSSRSWHRILLDLDVPGAHGLSLALEIHRLALAPVTCIVTATDRQDFVAQVKALAFLGYIVKATPTLEFSTALARIFEGERLFPAPKTAHAISKAMRITRRQTEVLDLVRQGYSSKQIAAELSLTEGTVNNHMNAMMGILNVATRSHAVAKAIELGLLRMVARPL